MYFFDLSQTEEHVAPQPDTRYVKVVFDAAAIPDAHVSMGWFRFNPGQKGPRHVHDKEVEVYYCLHGQGEVVVEGRKFVMRPDTALYIPPRHHHETRNPYAEDFVFLGIFGPAVDLGNMRAWPLAKAE